MGVGQRLEQDGIDSTEDRGAGPDAEGEREHADDGESWVAAELAGGIAEVGSEGAERVFPSKRAHLLADDGHVAEFEASRAFRIFGGEAACLPGRDGLFEVLVDLVGSVVIGCVSPQ